MTPRWRSLLFIVIAAAMQLAFAELRSDARAEAVEPRLVALGETRVGDAERALAGLRESQAVERGAQKRKVDGKPEVALGGCAAVALPACRRDAAPEPSPPSTANGRAPRERWPTGPPAAA